MKNTDTKDRILELLFDFPTRRFHVREIARILKISAPAVSKAVMQMEKEEFIILKKGFVYEIQANTLNQQFKNMKRVYNLRKIYLSGLFDFLAENFSLSAIILFGSYSKGEDTEKSDIDIAIEGKERSIELKEYEKKLNRKINIEFVNFDKISDELKDSIINGIALHGYISLK